MAGDQGRGRRLLRHSGSSHASEPARLARPELPQPSPEDLERERWLSEVLDVVRPVVVKGLACSSDGALLLLETGEVFTWKGDSLSSPQLVRFPSTSTASNSRLPQRQSSSQHSTIHQNNLQQQQQQQQQYLISPTQQQNASGQSNTQNQNQNINQNQNKEESAHVFIVQVEAGEDHFAARSASFRRNLYTWGANASGQLGLEDTRPRTTPCMVTGLEERVTDVICGRGFTICQTELGQVYGWGANNKGQLGKREDQPFETNTGDQSSPASAFSTSPPFSSSPTSSSFTKGSPGQRGTATGATGAAWTASNKGVDPPGSPGFSWGEIPQANDDPPSVMAHKLRTPLHVSTDSVVQNKSSMDVEETGRTFCKPELFEVQVDTNLVLSPQLIPHLCLQQRQLSAEVYGDESRGFSALSMDARGDHVVAWTRESAEKQVSMLASRDELVRLKHVLAEKRSQLADLDLRHQRVLNRWSGKTQGSGKLSDLRNAVSEDMLLSPSSNGTGLTPGNGYKSSSSPGHHLSPEHHPEMFKPESRQPSACSQPAELIAMIPNIFQAADLMKYSGQLETNMRAEVARDPGLEALDLRLSSASSFLQRETARVRDLEEHRDSIQARMKESEPEMSELHKQKLRLRKQIARIKESQKLHRTELDKIQENTSNQLANEAKVDRSKKLHMALVRDATDLEELEAQALEVNKTRMALEENSVDHQRNLELIDKERVSSEIRIHEIGIRLKMYQRLRIRRQQRLQLEYKENLQALWQRCIDEIHRVWEDLVLPADVFTILRRKRGEALAEGTPTFSSRLVQEAINESQFKLNQALQHSQNVIELLRQDYCSLEVSREVVGRAGAPPFALRDLSLGNSEGGPMEAALASFSSTLTMSTPSLQLCGVSVDIGFPAQRRSGAGHLRDVGGVNNGNNHSLLLLTRLSFSAMVGDELVLSDVILDVDGQGANARQFYSQEVMAILYEDSAGRPGPRIMGSLSQRVRVGAGASRLILKLEFDSPITVVARATRRGLGHVWVGLWIPNPHGTLRVYGLPRKLQSSEDDRQAHALSDSLYARTPKSLIVWLVSDGEEKQPPYSLDLVPSESKHRSPLHPYISAHALSVCDRGLRILTSVINERQEVNLLLASQADHTMDVEALVESLRLEQTVE